MNPKLVVTLALAPLAALAALVAPALSPAPPAPTPTITTTTTTTTTTPATPASSSPVHVALSADREQILASDRTARLKLELWADPGEGRSVPTDLVVVLDRSGSMSGTKILDARAAAHELVGQLGPEDRFALVSFASDVRVDVPLSALHADARDAWDRTIDRIEPGGGTGMYAGLVAGLDLLEPVAGRARRVVLVSDGLPDDRSALPEVARRAARDESPLTAIGIGMDYDEALMQSLADAGTGNFHWVQRGPELARVLADELSTARETVASNVEIRLDGATLLDAAGYPIDRDTVALGTLYAGQRRSLWLTVRAPEGSGRVGLGSVDGRFTTPAGSAGALVADAPVVDVTDDLQRFYASLGDEWAQGVVENDWNKLKIEVSAAVQQGDKQAALEAIGRYRSANELANAYAMNPVVTDNLQEVDRFAREVEGNFVGADQRARQNEWAKGTRVEGYLGTRKGQLKE